MRHLIKGLFQKWDIVHSTQDIDAYYKAKARLSEHNIAYKTEIINSGSRYSSKNGSAAIYHIKVKEEDIRRSIDAIQR